MPSNFASRPRAGERPRFWRGAVVPVRGARVLVARRVLDIAEAAPASFSADVAAMRRNECLLIGRDPGLLAELAE